MKRTLALLLAAIMLAASLVSCAVAPKSTAAISAKIRLTSSDAADAAAWLDARLGDALTDRVLIGTDAAAYGSMKKLPLQRNTSSVPSLFRRRYILPFVPPKGVTARVSYAFKYA